MKVFASTGFASVRRIDSRSAGLAALAALLVTCAGCDARCPEGLTAEGRRCTSGDAGTQPTDTAPREPIDLAHDFVVGRAWYPVTTEDSTVAEGLDLDGRVSDGSVPDTCEHARADFEHEGRAGIDNEFSRLVALIDGRVPTDMNGALEDWIRSGDRLIVLRVTSDAALADDDSAYVEYVIAEAEGTLSSDENGLLPGQRLRRVESFGRVPAIIERGTIRATAPPLAFPTGPSAPGWGIHLSLATRGGMWARISMDGMVDGSFGGAVAVAPLVSAVLPANLLARHADIGPSSGDPSSCRSISVGIGFRAVPVTLAEEGP